MSSDNDPNCPFCTISTTYAPFPPTHPPKLTSSSSCPISPTKTTPETHLILSTPTLISFLDILPLQPLHLLLCPRSHRPKLTSVTRSEASEMGRYLAVLSRAVVKVTGSKDWNVVQNNGVGAGQVVGHVHFHVVPRRGDGGGNGGVGEGRFSKSYVMFAKGMREELDDEEGREMAELLREAVAEILRKEEGEEEEEEEEEEDKEQVEERGEEKKKNTNKESKL